MGVCVCVCVVLSVFMFQAGLTKLRSGAVRTWQLLEWSAQLTMTSVGLTWRLAPTRLYIGSSRQLITLTPQRRGWNYSMFAHVFCFSVPVFCLFNIFTSLKNNQGSAQLRFRTFFFIEWAFINFSTSWNIFDILHFLAINFYNLSYFRQ